MEKPKRKLNALSLSEKVKIIREVELGIKKKKVIAEEYGIPPSTLSTILKDKDKFVKAVNESVCPPQRKRLKTSSFPQLEESMVQWLRNVRDKNIPVSGDIIREKAEKFAKDLGIDSFQASSGWLEKFKIRNGIVQRVLSGEGADVSEIACDEYRQRVLPALLEGYKPDDIFNADETGLFFKCLPDKTLAFKGEKCQGGKRSKERITVMVAANMTGNEKLKLLVIGKSAKPRCFSGVKALPVLYENNKRAWMTSSIFESWIEKIDIKFHREIRKVLLFIDNCPAHPKVLVRNLQAVKLVYLPPNTTSKLQPMDQGVIKNLKHYYRKRAVSRIIRNIEANNPVNDMNLLDAIHILQKSWEDVKPETIANCFRKAGFTIQESANVEVVEESTPIPEPLEWTTFQEHFKCQETNFDAYLDVDSEVIVAEHPSDEDIINAVTHRDDSDEGEEDEIDSNVTSVHVQPTVNQAFQAIDILRTFIHGQSSVNESVFTSLNLVESFVEKVRENRVKQMKMTDFFKP